MTKWTNRMDRAGTQETGRMGIRQGSREIEEWEWGNYSF
jgi:hypothetical protein